MKSSSEDLFTILKSLNRGEKLFLSKYLKANSKKEESALLRLFDLLEKQNQYDEDKLVEKLGISRNNFAVIKNQATNLVLEAVFQKESGVSEKGKLYKSMILAEYFFKKGQYEFTEKLCAEVIQVSTKMGYFTLAIEAEDLKNKVLRHELHLDKIEKYCEEKNVFIHLQNLEQSLWLRHYYDAVSAHILKEPDMKGVKAKLDIEEADQYVGKTQAVHGLENERLFLQLKLMIASGFRSISSISLMKQTMSFFEEHPEMLKEHFHEYSMFNVLFYYLYSKIGDKKSLDIQCNRFLKISESDVIQLTEINRIRTKVRIQNMQLNFCLENGLPDFMDINIEAFEAYFLENEASLGSLDFMWFCHVTSYYHFVNNELREAHKWIYRLINSKFYPERTISHPVTRLYLLFLQFDMQNFDYLRHELHNTKRYFSVRNLQEQIEFSIIKSMLEVIDGGNKKNIFLILRKNLDTKEFKRYLTVNIRDHFNTEAWIEAKIQGKTFRESMKVHKSYFLRFFRPFIKPKEELPKFMVNLA